MLPDWGGEASSFLLEEQRRREASYAIRRMTRVGEFTPAFMKPPGKQVPMQEIIRFASRRK